MRKHKLLKRLIPFICGLTVLFCLNSCASMNMNSSAKCFFLLGDDYDLVFQIPVRENITFAVRVLQKYTDIDTFTLKMLLRKCSYFYGNIILNSDGTVSFKGILTGYFPSFAVKEFEKMNEASLFKTVFVSSSMAIFTNEDVLDFYSFVTENMFSDLENQNEFLIAPCAHDIIFNIRDTQRFFELSNQNLISFGIERSSLKLTNKHDDFTLDYWLELKDSRASRVAVFLLNKIFTGANIEIVSDKIIKISNIPQGDLYLDSLFTNLLGGY